MKVLIVLIGFIVLIACEKKPSKENTSPEIETIEESQVTRITKSDIENLDYIEYGLSTASKKAVANWASYKELETLIESIKNADISYFEGDEKIMTALIQDLRSTIPEKVDNQSITARISALETKFHKLKSAVRISKTSNTELIATIKEFFISFSNLNLQMNKKLEKEAQDISKGNL
jgi:hypothetical protein